MLDDAFTYGGWLAAAIALCGAAWLALRAYPSFDAFVRGFDEDLPLDDTPAERAWNARWRRVERFTVVLAVFAVVSLAIGYAIPD